MRLPFHPSVQDAHQDMLIASTAMSKGIPFKLVPARVLEIAVLVPMHAVASLAGSAKIKVVPGSLLARVPTSPGWPIPARAPKRAGMWPAKEELWGISSIPVTGLHPATILPCWDKREKFETRAWVTRAATMSLLVPPLPTRVLWGASPIPARQLKRASMQQVLIAPAKASLYRI